MKYFLFCICLIKFSSSNGQSDLFNSTTNTKNMSTLEAYDLTGKRIPTGDRVGIEGSPMFRDQFVKGVVKFKNGQEYKDVLLNLSLTNNELYFKKDSTTLAFLYPVDEFALTGTANEKNVYFKSGFPVAGTNSEKSLYQVLSRGSKVCLLKYLYKIVEEHYEYGGPVKKEYVLKSGYYIYDVINNKMSEINLSSSSIKKSLPGYAEYIERFIAENKLNLKKEENAITLVDFINRQI